MEQISQEAKTVNIFVNGQKKEWNQAEISFDQVVNLAYNNNPPTGSNVMFTVAYSRGVEGKPQGTLLQGQSVEVKDGMFFDVTATNKS